MGWRAIPIAAWTVPLCLIAEVLPIRSYTTVDGLAADRIDCIVPDSRGFVWFCTPEGLTRFDGYRMVSFGTADGLPDRGVEDFLETRAGAYFAGTERGLSQLHSSTGGKGFVTYRQGAARFDKPIYSLLESPSGRIWCGTSEGFFEVLGGVKFRPQPLPGFGRIAVTDIREDADGKLWVATVGGIYVFGKDGAVQRITKQDGLPNEWVNALLLDRAGRLWAGTRAGLVLMRDADAQGRCGVRRVYRNDGSAELNVSALAEGSDGAIWMGTENGISRLLPGSGDPVFRNLTSLHGLSDRAIVALAADKAGNMWAGTEGAGVMRIGSSGFVTFHEQDGLRTDRVFSVFEDRSGKVLAVTNTGNQPGRSVNVFDGFKFHAVVPKVYGDNAAWGQHQILLQSRTGEWWAATNVGLCRFAPVNASDLAGRQPKACYAQDVQVFRVFEDSKGGIWASAQSARGDRLMRWDPTTKAISSFDEEGRGLVSAFAEDRNGSVWMGFWRAGLLRYDGRQFTRFKPGDGVPGGAIMALLVDHSGRLWIGSDGGGLGFLESPGRAPLRVRTYDTTSGLSSNTIVCVVEDDMGRIYAGTWKGVDRLDPKTGRTKHFSFADGLARGSFRSAFRDSSGNLWFATTQGLSRLTPVADRPPAIPTVLITDLKIFGKAYPVSPAGETIIRPPKLDPSRNQLQVEFVGFNDEPEENLRYTYKLEGAGSDWTKPERDHEANYPGLMSGHYRFLVKAVNSEDQPSTAPAEIDFVVLPPFWRRWWFEALALAGLVAVVLAAYRFRLQEMTARVRLRYEERLDERTRIARELHDTLLQSLAGVSLQLDGVAKQIGPSSGAAAARIQAVRQQVEASFREARQKVQDLRSPMLQGRTLAVVLREALEQIAAGHLVRLRMTVSGQPRPLHGELEETVLRIGQEAVANAVRHAQASEIQVLLAYDQESLSLRVQDDGQGFDLDDARHRVGHWGLRNMQERAHRIGAEWKITSAAGRGTGIEAIVPLAAGKPELWNGA